MPGITLNDVCLASMSAVAMAAAMIRAGEATTVLAGGFDSMTRAPHAIRLRPGSRMGDVPMTDVMVHDGLYCSIADEGMGGMSDAENARLGRHARGAGPVRGATPTPGRWRAASGWPTRSCRSATCSTTRACARRATTTLAALQPAFTADGTITAGNASQVSDGAAAAVITSAERAPDFLAEVVGRAVVAGPDSTLHLRPAEASAKLLDALRPRARRHRAVGDQRGLRGRRAGLGDRARARPRHA